MALVQIRLRHDRSADWAASTVLARGEVGVETDTGRLKVGDGSRNWANLPYADGLLAANQAGQRPSVVGTESVGTASVAARADHSHALPASPSFSGLAVTGFATVGETLSAKTVSADSFVGVEIADVDGLSAALGAKAASTHNHDIKSLEGFPSTQGNTGRVLSWNGSSLSWVDSATGSSVSVAEGDGISVTDNGFGSYTIALDDSVVNRIRVIPSNDPSNPVDLTGNVTLSGGANIQITRTSNDVVISATGGGAGGTAGVASVNDITGNVAIRGAVGGGITVTPSGSDVLLSASIPDAGSETPAALSGSGSAGSSTDYARSDHVHPLPSVDQLTINGSLDYSGFNLQHSNAYTTAQAPSADSVEGMFAEVEGAPQYSNGTQWVTLSMEGHNHSISDVSGLSDAIATIPSAGDYVATVNGASPDAEGNINIAVSGGAVTWDDIGSRPTNLSYFTNDGNGDAEGAFVTAAGAADAAPVQSVNNQAGNVSLTASGLTDFNSAVFASLAPGQGLSITQESASSNISISLAEAPPITGEPPADDTPVAPPDVPSDPTDPSSPPVASRSASIAPSWSGLLADSSGQITGTSSGFVVPDYTWEYLDREAQAWEPIPNDPRFTVNDSVLVVQRDFEFDQWSFRAIVRDANDPTDPGLATNEVVLAIGGGVRIDRQPEGPITIYESEADTTIPNKLRVTTQSGSAQVLHQWQVSRLPSEQEAIDLGNGIIRGQLFLNLPGGTKTGSGEVTSYLGYSSLVSPAVGDFIELDSDQGVMARRLYVRCKIFGSIDSFTLQPLDGSSAIYSDEVEVLVVKPLPDFLIHPTDDAIVGGEATFSASTEFASHFAWHWDYAVDSDGNRQFGGFRPIPSTNLSVAVNSSDESATYTATLSGLTGEHEGVRVKLKIMDSEGRFRWGQSARITGAAPVAGLAPETSLGSNLLLDGQEFRLQKKVSFSGQLTVEFQSRTSDSSAYTTIYTQNLIDPSDELVQSGTIPATLAASGTQYRARLSAGTGTAATPPLTIEVRSAASQSGGLEDTVIDYGRTFEAEVQGPLLQGAEAADHWVTVAVEYLTINPDGTFTATGDGYYIRPLNGQLTVFPGYEYASTTGSGLAFYRAGAARTYSIGGITVDRPLRISIVAAVSDPSNYPSLSLDGVSASPWSRNIMSDTRYNFRAAYLGGNEFQGASTRIGFPATRYAAYSSSTPGDTRLFRVYDSPGPSGTDEVVPISFGDPGEPNGFAKVAIAVVTPIPPRPISFNLTQTSPTTGQATPVVSFIPEHYHFSGAADQNGNVVVCAKDFWRWMDSAVNQSAYYLRSDDEGETFSSRMFLTPGGQTIGSISVRQIYRWNNRFWIAYERATGDMKVRFLYSTDGGFTWTKWVNGSGQEVTFPHSTMMSVANGWMLASWGTVTQENINYTVMTVARFNQAGWRGSESFSAPVSSIALRPTGWLWDPRSTDDRITPLYHALADIKYINGQYVSSYGAVSANPRNGWMPPTYADPKCGILLSSSGSRIEDCYPELETCVSEVSVVPGLGSYAIRGRNGFYEQVLPGALQNAGIRLNAMTDALVPPGAINGRDSLATTPIALGPQVGYFMYGQVINRHLDRNGRVDPDGSDLFLAKLNAYSPSAFRLLRTTANTNLLPGITYTREGILAGQFVTKADYSSRNVSQFLKVGGYIYGPTAEHDDVFASLGVDVSSQLPDRYLNGTDCPEYSDTIYTKNKVLKFYRSDLRLEQADAPSSSPRRFGFERNY